MESIKPLTFFFAVFGSERVGKTSFLRRFGREIRFMKDKVSKTTSFTMKLMDQKGKRIQAQIYLIEINSQSSDQICAATLGNCHGLILLCSVIDERSYYDIPIWYNFYQSYNPGGKVVFVGNKIDRHDQKIFPIDCCKFTEQVKGSEYHEISSTSGMKLQRFCNILLFLIKEATGDKGLFLI